jgi:quinoprotein glucose dehydrogenase
MQRNAIAFFLALSGLILGFLPAINAQTKDTGAPLNPRTRIRSAERGNHEHSTWSDYAGGADAAQYSALAQINRSNVSQLQVAWSYPTADGNKYLFNPIVVDRTMYVLAQNNSIVALDAATGRELWVHRINAKTRLVTNRGINYWQSSDRSDRRLLFAADNFLQEVDARTGQSIVDFGNRGRRSARRPGARS